MILQFERPISKAAEIAKIQKKKRYFKYSSQNIEEYKM